MSWALRDLEIFRLSDSNLPRWFPDVFFLPASSQLLIILLEIQPCVVSFKSVCVLAINGFNQRSSIFQHPFHLNKKKLHHKVSSWWIKKTNQKLNMFYCNYKNVIAYVKYTDVICLYQRNNIYELLVEKLKPSSFINTSDLCFFPGVFSFFCGGCCVGSMLVFTKLEARFPQGLAFKMGTVQ